MPEAQRLASWAAKTGPAMEKLITTKLMSRGHPQQAYRTCLGVCLGKAYGDRRLEATCRRALILGSHNYKSIESIFQHRLDE
jgi:hypothetical protein